MYFSEVELPIGSVVRQMGDNFGGMAYKDITNVHPISIILIVVLGFLTLTVPRHWALLPLIMVACFVSAAQKITVMGMDFNLLRIMILFGTARLIIHQEYLDFKWCSLDKVLVAWVISSAVVYAVRFNTFSAVVNRLGVVYDAFGMYFLFRCLIRSWLDVDRIVLGCIWISIPVAMFFFIENRTGRNMFSVFGGVKAITAVRDGRLRCMGAYSHPIIAGCFWVALLPLSFAYYWRTKKDRIWATMGTLASLSIIAFCASSTPVMGVMAAFVGGSGFFLRPYLSHIRWGIVLSLVALHVVMEAPVWHLISRVSAVGGSTGYFRFKLIDSAITHFSEWALFGTHSTAHWFWGAQDLCNQYVYEGVQGGILSLGLFICLISVAFHQIGRLHRFLGSHRYRAILTWSLGVSLFVQCCCFVGISYYGQIWVVWYLILAMIGSLSVLMDQVTIPSKYSRLK